MGQYSRLIAVKNNIYTTLELNMYSPEDMLFMYQEKAKEQEDR